MSVEAAISLILLLFGTFGNVVTMFVLHKSVFNNLVSSVYLQFLAITDTIVIYTGLMRKVIFFFTGVEIRSYVPEICGIHKWLTYSSLHCSAWIRISFTVQRVLHTWIPQKAKIKVTKRTARIIMRILITVILLVNGHLLYGHRAGEESEFNVTQRVCVFVDSDYEFFMGRYWPIIDFAFYSAIPTILMITGNILIIVRVLHSRRKVELCISSTTSSNNGPNSRTSRFSSMTVVLIMLNIFFVIFTSPVGIFLIGFEYWYTNDNEELLYQVFDILDVLQYVDNCSNFLLYCLTGSIFRREVVKMFTGKKCLNDTRDNEENMRNVTS